MKTAVESRPAATGLSAVRALDLCKSIDARPILQDVSLDIPDGSYVAVLGANGAGKSTLLKILATLVRPTSGDLALFGQTVGTDAAGLRARIGIIGHQSMLYRELSARDNLLLFGRLYGVPDAGERAIRMLERVGLAGRAGDAVKTFSRGMLQRTAIARALLHEPDLLLADEPFTGLDAGAVQTLEDLLKLLHAAGKTIVMAHHDVEQSLRMADQAIVLRQGRVVVDRCARQLDPVTAIQEMTAA